MNEKLVYVEKEFKKRVIILDKLGINKELITPVSFDSVDVDGPTVLISQENYIIKSRGSYEEGYVDLLITKNLNEFLFKLFSIITFMYSADFERKNRIQTQDSRIIAFKKHIQILENLYLEPKLIDELKEEYNNLLNIKLFEI